MMPWKRLGASALITGLLAAQPALVEDPVMKAVALRQADGTPDPPSVTRGVQEPPPLPPPESHIKDTPGYRASRRAKRTVSRTAARGTTVRRKTGTRIAAAKPAPAAAAKKKLPPKKRR